MRRNFFIPLSFILAIFLLHTDLYGDTLPNSIYLYKGDYEKGIWRKRPTSKEEKDNTYTLWSLLQKGTSLYLSTYNQEADIYIQDKRNRTVFKQSVGASNSMLEISTAGLRPGEYYICILTDDEMWYGSFEI